MGNRASSPASTKYFNRLNEILCCTRTRDAYTYFPVRNAGVYVTRNAAELNNVMNARQSDQYGDMGVWQTARLRDYEV